MSEATIPAQGPVDVTVWPHWHEVSKDEFFRRIGDMDVTPYPIGDWPYTSHWKTRRGDVVAKTVDYLPEGSALPKTRYIVRRV